MSSLAVVSTKPMRPAWHVTPADAPAEKELRQRAAGLVSNALCHPVPEVTHKNYIGLVTAPGIGEISRNWFVGAPAARWNAALDSGLDNGSMRAWFEAGRRPCRGPATLFDSLKEIVHSEALLVGLYARTDTENTNLENRLEELRELAEDDDQKVSETSANMLRKFVIDRAIPNPLVVLTPGGDFRAIWKRKSFSIEIDFLEGDRVSMLYSRHVRGGPSGRHLAIDELHQVLARWGDIFNELRAEA